MTYVGVALIPGVLAWLVIALLLRLTRGRLLADHPNERSLHSVPTPRIGGIGILAGVLLIALARLPASLSIVLAAALLLWGVSLADDIRSLPVLVRLAAHSLAALTAMAAIGGIPQAPLEVAWWLGAALAIAWTTNLFNFMDGSDGLAGGMAAIGFAAYAIAAWRSQETALLFTAAALSSASVGFLVHNFPPARTFLGDSGSIPLGFLAGALGIYGGYAGAWPWFFPLVVFSPFIVDASITLLRRIVRREAIWKAHRSHYYQRLVLAGWSRRDVALRAYLLMAAAGVSALVLQGGGLLLQCGIIFGWSAVYSLMLYAIDRTTTRKSQAAP